MRVEYITLTFGSLVAIINCPFIDLAHFKSWCAPQILILSRLLFVLMRIVYFDIVYWNSRVIWSSYLEFCGDGRVRLILTCDSTRLSTSFLWYALQLQGRGPYLHTRWREQGHYFNLIAGEMCVGSGYLACPKIDTFCISTIDILLSLIY